jgi:hypothetical protein
LRFQHRGSKLGRKKEKGKGTRNKVQDIRYKVQETRFKVQVKEEDRRKKCPE